MKDIPELLARAEQLARAREWSQCSATLGSVVEQIIAEGGIPSPHLLERLGDCAARAGRIDPAFDVLRVARELRHRAGDQFGTLAFGIQLAELALAAGQARDAGEIFADQLAPDGNLGPLPPSAETLLSRIDSWRWSGITPLGQEQQRLRTALAGARVWAGLGQYAPACKVLRWTLARAPRGTPFLSAGEAALMLGEMELDRGDLKAFKELEGDRAMTAGGATLQLRWNIVCSRARALEGRLTEARKLAREALENTPRARLEVALPAALALAQHLTLLNRTLEAEEILDEIRSWHPLLPPDWKGRFEEALLMVRLRRKATADDWDDQPLLRESEEIPSGAAQSTAAPARFAGIFARAFNAVLAALSVRDLASAETAAECLRELAASTDSPRFRQRRLFIDGLLDEQRCRFLSGEPQVQALALAIGTLQTAADAAEGAGWLIDEWQAVRALTWSIARSGDRGRHSEVVARLQTLEARICAGLDLEDQTRRKLNQNDAYDDFVANNTAKLLTALARPMRRLPLARLVRRLSDGARVRRTYRAVSSLVNWQVNLTLEEHAQEPHRTEAEVEAWMAVQLRLEAGSGRKLGLPAPWRMSRRLALLHFYSLADQLIVFRFRGLQSEGFRIAATRIALRDAATAAVKAIRQEAVEGVELDACDRLQELSVLMGLDRLLAGVPRSVRELVIVPHGAIVNLPVSALVANKEPLCARFAVTVLPSDRLFRIGSRAAKPTGRYLGVGVRDNEQHGVKALPRASDEATAVGNSLAASTRVLLDDETASSARVAKELPFAEWAHFACHGYFDRDKPHRSRLLLAKGESLDLRAIRQLDLRGLRGAFFAACWLGDARLLPGNEIISLPAAVLRAGASAAVACLWEVDDEASIRFAQEVSRGLATRSTAEALAEVQRHWLADRSSPLHLPFYWAGHVAYGQR